MALMLSPAIVARTAHCLSPLDENIDCECFKAQVKVCLASDDVFETLFLKRGLGFL